MIVIYTQDETIIRKDADAAKKDLIDLYGAKLGEEAYAAVKDARVGASYRKNGGPLVRVVTKEQAAEIREKETYGLHPEVLDMPELAHSITNHVNKALIFSMNNIYIRVLYCMVPIADNVSFSKLSTLTDMSEDMAFTIGVLVADYEQQFSREFILNYADIFSRRSDSYINFLIPGYRKVRDSGPGSITVNGEKYIFERDLFNNFISHLQEEYGVRYEYSPILILQEFKGLNKTNRRIVIKLSTSKAGTVIDQIIEIAHREVNIEDFSRELKKYRINQVLPQIVLKAINKLTGDGIIEVFVNTVDQLTQYDIRDR